MPLKNSNKLQQTLFDLLPSLFRNLISDDDKRYENTVIQKSFFEDLDKVIDVKKSYEDKEIANVLTDDNGFNELIVTELFDYLYKRENANSDKETRYNDNLCALELLIDLEKRNALANKKEQIILSKYTGFLGLEEKFNDKESSYELKRLLGKDYERIKNNLDSDYSIPYFVARFIYNAIEKLGFEKGTILDPNCRFSKLINVMPEDMYFNSRITAFGADGISEKLIRHLSQSTNFVKGTFLDVDIKDNSFDLVISDLSTLNETNNEIVNYKHRQRREEAYILKTLDKVRDNGLLIFICSTNILDSENDKIRNILVNKCQLLASIRLPYNTFSKYGRSTDIIMLKKGTDDSAEDTLNYFLPIRTTLKNIKLNQYYYTNTHMMIGEMQLVDRVENGTTLVAQELISKKNLDNDTLNRFLKYIPLEVYECALDDSYMYEESMILKCNDRHIKEGEFVIIHNKIYQKQNDNYIPKYYTGVRKAKFLAYIVIKDMLKKIIVAQLDNCSDDDLSSLQDELCHYYDRFVKEYGYLSLPNNKKILSEDILYYSVSCLEAYNIEDKMYYKSEIFTKRIISLSIESATIENVEDGLLKSYNTLGRLDLAFIAKVMNRDLKSVIGELLMKKLIYFNPINNKYESRNEYLSGNIREKLVFMKKNYRNDKRYAQNIIDLEINLPEYVTDVYFDISSVWIPIEIKEEFIRKTLRLNKCFALTYSSDKGYKVVGNYYIEPSLNQVEWGTSRRGALEIVEKTLNMVDAIVKDVDGSSGNARTNAVETSIAMEKQEKWRRAFYDYIANDNTLNIKLLDIYNNDFIKFKEREYENILSDLRINPNIKLMEHQLKAASRIIVSNYSNLLAHSVGLGKTYSSVCAIMEWGRIGENELKLKGKNKERKIIGTGNALFVVPNSLCESGQFARDFLKLYPYANILALTSKDFSKANRKKTLWKIKNHKWDSIIMPHMCLKLIPLKCETLESFILEEINELKSLLAYYEKEGEWISVNQINKEIDKKQSELLEIKKDKFNGIYFEDLNIDRVVVDEFHHFKNLMIKSKLKNISGVSNAPSMMAEDLKRKLRYFRSVYGDKGVVLLSATPVSNSMSELYVINEYIGTNLMKENGINSFDEWASRFGKIINSLEIDPTGTGYKFFKRFSKFYNVPELVTLFRIISDVVFTEDVLELKLPKVKGDKATVIEIERTDEMGSYVNQLLERAERIWNPNCTVSPSEDNMLKIVGEGRALAISPYLLGVKGKSPKVDIVCENVYRLYQENTTLTHLIFCDLGTPKSNSKDDSHCVYDEIKEKLIELGINRELIAYIHDGNTAAKRKEITEKFNNGTIKILIGSSDKMGEGVNLQQRVKSCHEVDCPWKPSQVFQREGRVVRQGNTNEEVEIYRYVVRNTFDAYSWQTVERKANFIQQVLNNKSSVREVEDVNNDVMSFAECKACASGDNRIKELYEISSEVQKLHLLEKAHKDRKARSMREIDHKKSIIKIDGDKVKIAKRELEMYLTGDKEFILHDIKIRDKDNNVINLYDFESGVEKLQTILSSGYEGVVGSIGNLEVKALKIVENNKIVNKCFVGESISFTSKKSAKEIMSNLKSIEESFKNKISILEDNIVKLKKEIIGLEDTLGKEFLEKKRLNELLMKKFKLETELSINNDRVYNQYAE